MSINPQMLMQVLMNKNPQLMQQMQQYRQQLQNNQQLMNQFRTFKNNMQTNPQMREQVLQEAINKMGLGPNPGRK